MESDTREAAFDIGKLKVHAGYYTKVCAADFPRRLTVKKSVRNAVVLHTDLSAQLDGKVVELLPEVVTMPRWWPLSIDAEF